MNRYTLTTAALLAAAITTGCVERERVYYEDRHPIREREVVVVNRPAPPPVVVYRQIPPPPPRGQEIIVQQAPPMQEQVTVIRQAPPPVIVERRPNAPGRDFIWLPGYWVLHQNRWVWVSGRWDRPPHPGAVWVPHHWEHVGPEFHFTVGVWH